MSNTVSPFLHISLNTDIWQPEQRWNNWQAHISQFLPYSCDLVYEGSEPFSGIFHAARHKENGDSFSKVIYSGNTAIRNNKHLADGYQDYMLAFCVAGKGSLQRGQQVMNIRAGGIYLLDMGQTLIKDTYGNSQMFISRIPRAELEPLIRGRDDNKARQINTEKGSGYLLKAYLQMLPRAVQQSSQASSRYLFQPIADLVKACLTDEIELLETSELGRMDALYNQCLEFMGDHLADGHLSVELLSRRYQVSSSYLHRVFRKQKTTFSQQMRRLRINQACQLLAHGNAPLPMNEVALQCGFNGLSQFSRAFKSELGVTASDFRRE